MTDLLTTDDDMFLDIVAPTAPPESVHAKNSPKNNPSMGEAEARAFLADFDTKFLGIPTGVGNQRRCPICQRITRSSSGFNPHWKSHRAEAEVVLGLPVTPSRSGRITKKQVEQRLPEPEPRVEVPTPATISEGLLALLPFYLGDKATVPVGRLHELQEWLSESERFINSLRR
jgi:hypothetical protein